MVRQNALEFKGKNKIVHHFDLESITAKETITCKNLDGSTAAKTNAAVKVIIPLLHLFSFIILQTLNEIS